MPDPQLTVYNSAQGVIAADAGWGGDPSIAAEATALSAFPYTNPASATRRL